MNSQDKGLTWLSDNDEVASVVFDFPYEGTLYANLQHRNAVAKFFADHGVGATSMTDTIIRLSTEKKEAWTDFLVSQFELVADFSLQLSEEEAVAAKKRFADNLSTEQLAHALSHVYTFNLYRTDGTVAVRSYTAEPMTDLLQLRAHLITPKGVVVSSSRSIRHRVNVLRKWAELSGFKVVAKVPDPLRFSGADYVPAGSDLAFIGVGPQTDEAAVRFLLGKNVFGTTRVAVVRDLFDRAESRQNLSSVFQLVGADTAVLAGTVVGSANLRRRLVNEYTYVGDRYRLNKMGVEFSEYLKGLGYNVIEVPESLHDEVGLPIINLGLGKLLVSDERVASLIKGSSHFKGSVQVVAWPEKHGFARLSNSILVLRKLTEGSSLPASKESEPALHTPVWRPQDGTDVPAKQTTNCILMVAPVGFQSNEETAADNYFMNKTSASALEIEAKALREFSAFHQKLSEAGVTIFLHCSERFHKTPDAVFPNNWFSTHPRGESDSKESLVVFYPMKTESRRAERRQNIVDDLVAAYDREISFTQWEFSDFPRFLESTGVLIMDRIRKVVYATLSQRCSGKIARIWAKRLGYKLCVFHSLDDKMRPIYHTNVMMSVGTSVSVVCLESVEDKDERRNLVETLSQSHEIVEITKEQMNNFCGNVLELKGVKDGKERKLLVMSTKSYNAFTTSQKERLLAHVDELVHVDLDTIETIGGGGARCMMGEIF